MLTVAFLAVVLAATSFARGGLDGATIVNGGSTNTAPWSVSLRSDGSAWTTENGKTHSFQLQAAPAGQFFRDVAAARGVAGAQGCMKSVSFGSRTGVLWHRWNSPDLSCPQQDPRLVALGRDVSAIEEYAGVIPSRRIPLPVEPRRVPGGA